MRTINYESSSHPIRITACEQATNLPTIPSITEPIGSLNYFQALSTSGIIDRPTYFEIFTGVGYTDIKPGNQLSDNVVRIGIDPHKPFFFVQREKLLQPQSINVADKTIDSQFLDVDSHLATFQYNKDPMRRNEKACFGLSDFPNNPIAKTHKKILRILGVEGATVSLQSDAGEKLIEVMQIPYPDEYLKRRIGIFEYINDDKLDETTFNSLQAQGIRPISTKYPLYYIHDALAFDHLLSDQLPSVVRYKRRIDQLYTGSKHDFTGYPGRFDTLDYNLINLIGLQYDPSISHYDYDIIWPQSNKFDYRKQIRQDLREYGNCALALVKPLGKAKLTKKQYKDTIKPLVETLPQEIANLFGPLP